MCAKSTVIWQFHTVTPRSLSESWQWHQECHQTNVLLSKTMIVQSYEKVSIQSLSDSLNEILLSRQ